MRRFGEAQRDFWKTEHEKRVAEKEAKEKEAAEEDE